MTLNTKNPVASVGHSRRGRPRKVASSSDEQATYVSSQDERHKRDQQVNARVSLVQKERIESLFEQAKKSGFEGSKGDFISAAAERYFESRAPVQVVNHPTVETIDSLEQTVKQLSEILVPNVQQIPGLVSASHQQSGALIELSKAFNHSARVPSAMMALLNAMSNRMAELSQQVARISAASPAPKASSASTVSGSRDVQASSQQGAKAVDQPTVATERQGQGKPSVFRKTS